MVRYQTLHKYCHLRSGEIRLVVLYPGKLNDAIKCSLVHANINDDVQYDCLSYVWGVETENAQREPLVSVNGSLFPVSSNLYEALACIRKEDKPRCIWVDQICINQTDDREKSVQILLMNKIYTSASQVLLFAGPSDATLVSALLFMASSSKYTSLYFENKHGFKKYWQSAAVSELNQSLGIPLPDHQLWQAFRSLLKQPCFRRTWIVQEVALAKELKLVFGPGMEFEWDAKKSSSFEAFFSMVCSRNHSLVGEENWFIGKEMVFARAMILTRSWTQLLPTSHWTHLLSLLDVTRKYDVTNPKDKIYGLLAVASDAKSIGIKPDYSKSIQEVYIDAARRIIKHTQSLEILKMVEVPKHDDTLPSWVPDWRSLRRELFGTEGLSGKPVYKATKGAALRLDGKTESAQLALEGLYLDLIETITSGPVDEGQCGDLVGYGLWWIRAKSAIGPVYTHTNESLDMALGRVRIADMCEYSQRFGGQPGDMIEVHENEMYFKHIESLGAIIETQTLYRILFTTGKKYMGLAPMTAQHGDMIYLVPGCDVPLLLRKLKDREFILIGQCYVHGEAFSPSANLERIELV